MLSQSYYKNIYSWVFSWIYKVYKLPIKPHSFEIKFTDQHPALTKSNLFNSTCQHDLVCKWRRSWNYCSPFFHTTLYAIVNLLLIGPSGLALAILPVDLVIWISNSSSLLGESSCSSITCCIPSQAEDAIWDKAASSRKKGTLPAKEVNIYF